MTRVREMEEAFGRGTALLEVPLRAIEVPFEGGTLPGYYLEQDAAARPTVLMIGGGDTFREDLKKYAWQLGTGDFQQAYQGVLQQATPVDYERISCPRAAAHGRERGC